jgi:vacuolar-type H+-ATPase subunit C/Vma6
MYAALLTPQDEARLAEAADLPALVGMLRDTEYGPHLEGLDEKGMSARQLIALLRSRVAEVYVAVIRSAPVSSRPLMIQLYRHFELNNLKAALRGIAAGSTWADLQDIWFPLGSLTMIQGEEMMSSGTIETALARVPHSFYREPGAHALKRYSEEGSLFPLEVALDLAYWRELWNQINHLADRDRAQTLRIMGQWLDLQNLMWALRYRIYHHLAEEEIINYTLPFGYRVRDDDIRAIAAGAEIAPIVRRLHPDIDNVEGLLQEPEHGLPRLELEMQRQIRRRFVTVFAGYPFHIGLPLAFVLLLEMEIQDLIVLAEAVSSGMKSEEFSFHLLLNPNPGG